jgi:hypothetical protein
MARTKVEKTSPVSEAVTESSAEVQETSQPAPAEIETKSLTEEPVAAAPAVEKEEIETDVKKKLLSRPQDEDIFAPASPAVLEAAAKKVAEEEGFELNRGTSIGARLLARSRKMV